ncbi:HlyD family secretion protein [Cerasicoccus arenae]|uniref:HlyD family secretion protein n=1 Tax=Cerasicoccus arenae TaxID=424488 RepID=A0A8J3DH00_9BACT|nr:HlyD family secretion protein [Cerasicoccus arenae]MBK1858525.1 efflux RND transporter periplasmic adaptor subunit [Cerasicoccus arenae]GHC06100.1 hypothetical protein GCM10007047_23920 [Cerasicoccus arenae]
MAEIKEKTKEAVRSRFNWLIWPVAIIGLIAAGIYGYQRLQFDEAHIVTDNAQVQGQLIKILAPERGWLNTVSVFENQPVTEGTILGELENQYYQLEVERAQAKLNALQARKGTSGTKDGSGLAQAKLATAQANLEVVQAQLSEAQSTAKQSTAQLQRMQSNKISQTFVQSQLDMAQGSADQANARLLTLQKEAYAAQQEVQEAMAGAQLLDYNIEEAKAELAQAQLNLSSTEIKSPINGHIAQLKVNPGTMVEQGQYLMTVVSDDDKWLVANIKETLFERIYLGDKVDVTIDAFPGTDFKGVVASLAPAAGNQFSIIPRNAASGNFIKVEALIPVVIRFTEPLSDIEKLVPGMSAEVTISVDAKRKWEPVIDPSKPLKASPAKDSNKAASSAPPETPTPIPSTPTASVKPTNTATPVNIATPVKTAKPVDTATPVSAEPAPPPANVDTANAH